MRGESLRYQHDDEPESECCRQHEEIGGARLCNDMKDLMAHERQSQKARQQAQCGADNVVDKTDPTGARDHGDDGEGGNRHEADGGNRENATAANRFANAVEAGGRGRSAARLALARRRWHR